MRSAAQYTVSTRNRDFEEFQRLEIRRARVREIALDILAGLAWLILTALTVFVCCAVGGYHWE